MLGRTILGKYEIIRFITSGGMSEIYLAFDRMNQRYVALKFLLPKLTTDSVVVERFKQEAELLKNAIEEAKVGNKWKLRALKALYEITKDKFK